MKILLFLILLISTTTLTAQNKDHLITMNGIGALKITMSQSEIEKMLNQKFTLPNALSFAVSHQDSAIANYKNAVFTLYFQRQYQVDNTFFMRLIGLKTSSQLFKTVAGIGVGSSKFQVLAAYKGKSRKYFAECDNEDCSKLSKTRFRVHITSKDGERGMIFYLVNNNVVAVEVETIFNDEE